MRNLKKVLSLLVAVAMMMSLAISASAIFPDQDKIENTEAVDMAVALGIIQGRDDGNFDPTAGVTRAEMAKMICVIMNGGKDPQMQQTLATYSDTASHWARDYIESCSSQGIVAGMGDGTFAPDAGVTGTQAAKMLLVALGYNAIEEDFNGINWSVKIGVQANSKDLYAGLDIDPGQPLTRDSAAQMIWNALQAGMVKYETKIVTDGTNVKTEMSRVDKTIIGANDAGTIIVTLLMDKYKTEADFTGVMTGYGWDSKNSKYTYTISDVTWDNADDEYDITNPETFKSTKDFTGLFGMNVKVVHKIVNNSVTVYGIIPDDAELVVTALKDDVTVASDNASFKVAGVKYTLESDPNKVWVCAENDYAHDTTFDSARLNVAYNCKAIDRDGNGKVDTIVYMPFTVGEVTYVDDDGITVDQYDAAGDLITSETFDFEDNTIYDDATKGDYVVIYAEANTAGINGNVFEKMTVTDGTLTDYDSNDYWFLDDAGYYIDAAIDGAPGETDLDSDYTFYVVGCNMYWAEKTDGASLKDLVLVTAYQQSGRIDDGKVKIWYTDGTSAVINVDKFKEADGDTYTVPNAEGDAQAAIENKLFTISEKSGAYTLKFVGEDNLLGFDGMDTTGAGITGKDGSKNAKLDGNPFTSDAVLFVVYNDDGIEVKVYTGTQAQKLRTLGGTSEYLYNTKSGVNNVTAGVLEANAIPHMDGQTDNYGYVTSAVKTNNDGDKLYTIWNGSESVSVKDIGGTEMSKGTVIRYTDLGNGEIDEVIAVADITVGATPYIGGIMKYAAGDIIALTDEAGVKANLVTVNVDETDLEISSDVKFLFINTADVKGLAGGTVQTAKAVLNSDTLVVPNAMVLYDTEDDEVVLIVVDVKNALSTGFFDHNEIT